MLKGKSGSMVTDYYYEEGPDCHLDEANGFSFPDGTYAYILTENYPFISTGYTGVLIAEICSIPNIQNEDKMK